MAKYKINNSDILDLAARKVYTAAPFSSSFTGEDDLQQAGTNTTNVTLTGYKIGATTCTAVKAGYMPSYSKGSRFWSSSTANSYSLKRTDSSLTIGSTTFKPTDFRDGVIPSQIIVIVVGGGGGGGGNGYFEHSKGEFFRTCSGAGGGGGYAVGRIDIANNPECTITVGGGGAVGNNGSSSERSVGKTGGDGGDSNISIPGTRPNPDFVGPVAPVALLNATGGKGGKGGDGVSGGTYGVPGEGGSGGSSSSHSKVITSSLGSGGKGNYYGHFNEADNNSMSFTATAGTGETSSTVISSHTNSGTVSATEDWGFGTVTVTAPKNKDDSTGDTSYFSGGCSRYSGAQPEVYDIWALTNDKGQIIIGPNGEILVGVEWTINNASAGGGGGGGGGSLKSSGGSGYVALYY